MSDRKDCDLEERRIQKVNLIVGMPHALFHIWNKNLILCILNSINVSQDQTDFRIMTQHKNS